MELYWEHFGLAAALVLSLFVLIGLAIRLIETDERRMFLWAMVAFFVFNALDALDTLAYSQLFSGPDWLQDWQNVLIPGFMVSLYFFVRGLTSSNPKLARKDLLHLLPFVGAFFCLSPTLIVAGDLSDAIDLSEGYLHLAQLGENAFWILWILVLIIYGALCVRRLFRHKRNIRVLFSDLDGKTLRWLDALVVTIFGLALLVIINEARLLLDYPDWLRGVNAMLYDVVLAGSFGIFALRAQPPLPQWSEEILHTPAPEEYPEARDVQGAQFEVKRYARSGLQQSDLDRYAARLEQRVADGRLWRDHALNLRRLAAEISIPSIHLSEVLNTKLGMSFYDYINQCRVRDACALLIETNMSILEISEAVGFNAKSTFNSSFKKVTEQTPSQWRKAHQP